MPPPVAPAPAAPTSNAFPPQPAQAVNPILQRADEDRLRKPYNVKGYSDRYYRIMVPMGVGNFYGPHTNPVTRKVDQLGEVVPAHYFDPRHRYLNRGAGRDTPFPEFDGAREGPDSELIANIERLKQPYLKDRPDLGPAIVECTKEGNPIHFPT